MGLLDTLGNVASTALTNSSNRKIAQMNNEFNERMLQKQMDYNTEMWEKENEYNTASAQRQRLEDAGLNPYMMMDGGSAGVASSVGGVTPPTADQSGRQVAPQFSGIDAQLQSLLNYKEQQRVNDANIDHVNADTRLKSIEQLTALMDAYSNARTSTGKYLVDTAMADTINQVRDIDIKNKEADFQQKTVNNLLLSKELAIFDEKNRLQLSNQIADTLLKTEHMKFTKQQRIHEIQKLIKTAAEIRGIKISNDVAQRSADAIVNRAYSESYSSMNPFGFLLHVLDNN